MADNPDKIQMVTANSMGESFVSKSLVTLHKIGNKAKAQFSFEINKINEHPLTYVFLIIDGSVMGSYILKPPILNISTVSTLNVDWEI
jgi:hypothetical protein